jgi:hypothetical protein
MRAIVVRLPQTLAAAQRFCVRAAGPITRKIRVAILANSDFGRSAKLEVEQTPARPFVARSA